MRAVCVIWFFITSTSMLLGFGFASLFLRKSKAPFRGLLALLPLDQTVGADGELAQLVEGLSPAPLDKAKGLTIKAVSAQVRPATLARELGEVRVEGITPLARGVVKGAEGVEGD
jgi:hypothetical protein